MSILENLDVNGKTLIKGALHVNSQLTAKNDLFVTGNIYQNGNLLSLDGASLWEVNNGKLFTNKNVGLGINNAQEKLHVEGKIRAGTGNNYIRLGYNGANAIMDNFGAGNLLINWYSGSNVAIGSPANPSNLTVNGTITAEAIDVKLLSSIEVNLKLNGFADYVFEEDYNLLPLDKVEEYIIENKHLPDVPSEDEVIENGLNIGEMNAILLQKIEELTLHMIDMKKENEILKNRIIVLENDR